MEIGEMIEMGRQELIAAVTGQDMAPMEAPAVQAPDVTPAAAQASFDADLAQYAAQLAPPQQSMEMEM